MGGVIFDAANESADEFFALHPEVTSSTDHRQLTRLLREALCNDDVASRLILVDRFLDWGADPRPALGEKSNVLHGFAQRLKDPVAEAPLFKRLLEMGADPNQQSPRYGLPLEILMHAPRLKESDLAPIYDVLFERPDLDFFITDRTGDSLWDKVWRVGLESPGLLARTERYIVEHTGAEPPRPRYRKKQPDGSWLAFHEGDDLVQDADGTWRIV